jgi:hypothetical protein
MNFQRIELRSQEIEYFTSKGGKVLDPLDKEKTSMRDLNFTLLDSEVVIFTFDKSLRRLLRSQGFSVINSFKQYRDYIRNDKI